MSSEEAEMQTEAVVGGQQPPKEETPERKDGEEEPMQQDKQQKEEGLPAADSASTCPAGDLPVAIEIECGPNKATMHLDKLQMGSKGACVLYDSAWLTPNEFQFVSGRETAKDWKRSIKHFGKSLKILLSRDLMSFRPPFCLCEVCSVAGANGPRPAAAAADTKGQAESPLAAAATAASKLALNKAAEEASNDRTASTPKQAEKKKRKRKPSKPSTSSSSSGASAPDGASSGNGSSSKRQKTDAGQKKQESKKKTKEPKKTDEPAAVKTEVKEACPPNPPSPRISEAPTASQKQAGKGEVKDDLENSAAAEPTVATKGIEDPHLQSPKITQSSPDPEPLKDANKNITAPITTLTGIQTPTPFPWYMSCYSPYSMMSNPLSSYAAPSLSMPYTFSPQQLPLIPSPTKPQPSPSKADGSSPEKPLDLSQRKFSDGGVLDLSRQTDGRKPMLPIIPSPITPRSPWTSMMPYYASPAPSNPHLDAVLRWSAEDVIRFVSSIENCSKYAKKFLDVGITGSSLPYMSMEHLMGLVQMQASDACALRLALDRLLFIPGTSFRPFL